MNVFRRFWNWLFPLKLVEVSLIDHPLLKEHASLTSDSTDELLRDLHRGRGYAEIAEKNRRRQRDTLGYGLKSRNFKPRSGFEKRQWNLSKKPDVEED